MPSIFLVLSFVSLTSTAEAPLAWENLAGEWVFVERSVNGKATPAEEMTMLRMVIAKDRSFLLYQEDRAVVQGTFLQSDPPGITHAVDRNVASRSEFSGKFEPVYRQKGLVRFEKDRLTMIFAREPGDNRPKEFHPKDAKGMVCEVLKRK